MKKALRIISIAFLWASPAFSQLHYQQTLESLSEPVAIRWQHFGPPYFSTNEKLLNAFYPRFENAGGVTIGVSFQQNLSILVHARPQLCIIFDFNPGVTEILVPFMGQLIAGSPTRQQFLSTLLGADFTSEETKQLLEGRTPAAEVLTAVLERTNSDKRKQHLDRLRDLLQEKFLDRLPPQATAYMRKQALNWIDILENQELLTGAFFSDAIAPYHLSPDPKDQRRLAGWLSSEENYARVRDYWMTGRIIGVTGDIGGSSVAKVAEYLRSRRLQVTVIYLSNVGLSVDGHFPETWFRDLYTTLGQLPVTSTALTLVAHGPWQLTGYVRTLKMAQWVYQEMATVPVETAIRLHEAPLEIQTQEGNAQLLPAIRKGLSALNAPPSYFDLLQQVQANLSAIHFMKPEQFRTWSAKVSPGIDTHSPLLQTMMVTFVESGLLAKPF